MLNIVCDIAPPSPRLLAGDEPSLPAQMHQHASAHGQRSGLRVSAAPCLNGIAASLLSEALPAQTLRPLMTPSN